MSREVDYRRNIKMRRDCLAFAFFAAAILFSMVREWSAPPAYLKIQVDRTVAAPLHR